MIRIAICEKDKKQQAQLLDYIAKDVDRALKKELNREILSLTCCS